MLLFKQRERKNIIYAKVLIRGLGKFFFVNLINAFFATSFSDFQDVRSLGWRSKHYATERFEDLLDFNLIYAFA